MLGTEERAFRAQVNAYRAEHGVARLKVSRPLTKAAKWMSTDMARGNYFDHVDSRGRGYAARVERFGFHGRIVGENLGAGLASAGEAVEAWKHSALS